MTLALLDGDIINYRAVCGTQETHDWGDTGGKVALNNLEGAVDSALRMVKEWGDAVKATDVMVCLTGDTKWRKRVLPSYQANRQSKNPIARSTVRKAMMERFPHQLIEGLEADDIMGILTTTDKYADDTVIVTIDKDLKTVPGRLFNPIKREEGIVTITPAEADWWWMFQTLVGDASDGYSGCPKIGPVKALSALGGRTHPWSLEKLWARAASCFTNAKLTKDDAIMQARMARILRRCDYDKNTKEIILWHPTTPTRIPLKPSSETGLSSFGPSPQ